MAVLTSAVRDASNGAEFTEQVRSRFGLDAQVLSGDEEAQLTFLGAMSDRPVSAEPTVVIDIGGGSTEFIVGSDHEASFHVSVQAGVLRMSERHIHTDPPSPDELQALAADTRSIFLEGLPSEQRHAVKRAIAVAGTATSAASIDQGLDPYDPERVHGYALLRATVELLIARLADITEAQRREVVGLHPDRAPTIVAGMILLGGGHEGFRPGPSRGLRARHLARRHLALGRSWLNLAASRPSPRQPTATPVSRRFSVEHEPAPIPQHQVLAQCAPTHRPGKASGHKYERTTLPLTQPQLWADTPLSAVEGVLSRPFTRSIDPLVRVDSNPASRLHPCLCFEVKPLRKPSTRAASLLPAQARLDLRG